MVNGEIYDYDSLRAEMVAKIDYQFRGRSDCELVLALYRYYGFSFLSHLRGEFAICLYDEERNVFIAVRDRLGIKPLFWTETRGELLVAAEIKALLPLGWRAEWDVKGIVDGGFQIGRGTIFKGVQKVSRSVGGREVLLTRRVGAARTHADLSAFWRDSGTAVLGYGLSG